MIYVLLCKPISCYFGCGDQIGALALQEFIQLRDVKSLNRGRSDKSVSCTTRENHQRIVCLCYAFAFILLLLLMLAEICFDERSSTRVYSSQKWFRLVAVWAHYLHIVLCSLKSKSNLPCRHDTFRSCSCLPSKKHIHFSPLAPEG